MIQTESQTILELFANVRSSSDSKQKTHMTLLLKYIENVSQDTVISTVRHGFITDIHGCWIKLFDTN